jgi:hypothetical protein
MSAAAVTASSARTSLLRYSRSMGLWILLLVAPIGARFMVAGRGAGHSLISVGGHVPWLTSPVLGMELGVVISTLLLPVAFIYLRANVNRRQPWQVEEPTAASRVAIAYGRWAADAAVMAALLAATTAAGWVLALILLPLSEVRLDQITLTVWSITLPPLLMVAGLRVLFDARPFTRGFMGEVFFFIFWMGTMILAIGGRHASGYGAAMSDIDGFMSPIAYAHGNDDFTIGGGMIIANAKPIVLDVMAGILAPGYLPARLTWLFIAALLPLAAGLIYTPHVAGKTRKTDGLIHRLTQPGRAPPADPNARAARPSLAPWLNLLAAEVRLIASGRVMRLMMLAVTLAAWFVPYAQAAGPAAMLLLVFATTAHAGRSEQKGLLALTATGAETPWARRLAFVVAGTILALAMGGAGIDRALTAATPDTGPLIQALIMGAGTSAAAIGLAALTRSATAPRLVLLIAWYMYLSWGGGGH